MKQIILVFFLSILKTVSAQEPTFTLSGNVTDCKTHKCLYGATLKLVCSDGRMIETHTDSLGNYFFANNVIKPKTKYVLSAMSPLDANYLNSAEKFFFDSFDTVSNNIKKNFCLVHNEGCSLRFPLLHFEKNSITKYTFDEDVFNFEFMKYWMDDNPTIVVEIGAHSSYDEKNPSQICQQRAEYLQKLLISKGFNIERIPIKNYGNDSPIVPLEEIKKMKTTKEKDEANKKNRRVVFNIVRKDYKAKTD